MPLRCWLSFLVLFLFFWSDFPLFSPPKRFLAETVEHVAMVECQFRGERGGGEPRKATKGRFSSFLSVLLLFFLLSLPSLSLSLSLSFFFFFFIPSLLSLTEMSVDLPPLSCS